MTRQILFGLLAILGVLVVVDRRLRHARAEAAAALQPRTAAVARPAARSPAPASQPPALPITYADAPPPATPTIDLLTRLATRRRLDRESSRVYLDSLLAETDSTLARWPDDDRTLTVAFVVDTTVPGWSNAIRDDARAAMHVWDNNDVGLRFREVDSPDSADVRVQWVPSLPDSGRVGVTALTVGPDGIVHGANVTLALHRNTDSIPLPPALRQRVAAHEFGHALGLPHSGNSDDIMFPSAPVAQPSRRDYATLLLLYAVPAGSVRTP